MSEVASAKNDGVIDLPRRLDKDDKDEQIVEHIAASLGKSLCHNCIEADGDETAETFGCFHFRDNLQNEFEKHSY